MVEGEERKFLFRKEKRRLGRRKCKGVRRRK